MLESFGIKLSSYLVPRSPFHMRPSWTWIAGGRSGKGEVDQSGSCRPRPQRASCTVDCTSSTAQCMALLHCHAARHHHFDCSSSMRLVASMIPVRTSGVSVRHRVQTASVYFGGRLCGVVGVDSSPQRAGLVSTQPAVPDASHSSNNIQLEY